MNYQGVIFDLDGTLIETIGLYEEAYIHGFSTLGVEVTHEEFERIYHENIHLGAALEDRGLANREREVRAMRDAYYMELLATKVEWYPDGKKLLEELPKDVPRAIVTGSWQMYVDAIEERLPISELVPVIVTADDIRPRGKPDPFGVNLAAKQMDVEPKECIYIGDQTFDVETAKNAGMASCLVKRKYTAPDADAGDFVVDSLEAMITQL